VPAARDEVQNYLNGQYVSASEACHRLFAFDLHGMHPNVYYLAIHLPNEQTTYFPERTTIGEPMMRNNSTTLIGWCDFNRIRGYSHFGSQQQRPCTATACCADHTVPKLSRNRCVEQIQKGVAPPKKGSGATGCRPKQSCHIGNCGAHVLCATLRGRTLLSASFAYPRCRGHML
jgi:hypothetical protein